MERFPVFLTICVLIGIGILFFINSFPSFHFGNEETFLTANQVRGMAVVHAEKPFTLNFDQQSRTIDYLNKVKKLQSNEGSNHKPFPIDKIIVYLFNSPDLEITILGEMENGNLLILVPAWNGSMPLEDTSQGSFKQLISHTYDS